MVNGHTVFDCCFFLNELDLLELRMSELDEVVDWFVVAEADQTHAGKAKPFYLKEQMGRFERWKDRIIRVEVTMPPGNDSWGRERHQRDELLRGLAGAKPSDWILFSDVDELPKPEAILRWNPETGPRKFEQMFCYYWVNCTGGGWGGTIIATLEQLQKVETLTKLRHCHPELPVIGDGGWHFSFMGGVDQIRTKLISYAHQDMNKAEYTNPAHILESIRNGTDIFNRPGWRFSFVPIDSRFPKAIQDDHAKWAKFIAPAAFHEEWYGKAQLLDLRQAVAQVKKLSGAIMEFGCWEGRSTAVIANECHPEPLMAIDTWSGNSDETPNHVSVQLAAARDVYAQFLANMQSLTKGNVQPSRSDCHAFMEAWRGPIKFAHIDASHDYQSVKRTIQAILPWLVSGGVLCGDDMETAHAGRTDLDGGVERAVRETLPGFVQSGNFWSWQKMTFREEEYRRRCQTVSDINEHLPTLRSYAEQCKAVAEFGVRHGNSTMALLAAQPDTILLYDDFSDMDPGKTVIRFHQQDSLTAALPEVDMLHIDTLHTYAQLKAELLAHGNKVRKFIAMHDTTTFGTIGSDGGKGLNAAIEEFLQDNPHWQIAEVRTNNNGMTILKRL